MKVISYIGSCGSKADVRLYADSAIGRDVMPLFVPEGFGVLQLSICLAVRIGRLGKGIAPKFVSRYIDAVSLVGVLSSSASMPLMCITDGAVTTGKWLPADISALPEIKVGINDHEHCLDTAALSIPSAVASISDYAILKTGDIIILDSSATAFDVVRHGAWTLHPHSPDFAAFQSELCCSIDGSQVLHLRLK